MLAAMLFTQGALAASACLRLNTGPQSAFAPSQMADCGTASVNPKPCPFQYLDQSDQIQPQPSVAATVDVAALVVDAQPAPVFQAHAPLPPRAESRPLHIIHCRLLN